MIDSQGWLLASLLFESPQMSLKTNSIDPSLCSVTQSHEHDLGAAEMHNVRPPSCLNT